MANKTENDMSLKPAVEIWGGMECTINRVGDRYLDQSEYSGHYQRGADDIDLIASLGIAVLRYPVLWEQHQPQKDKAINWTFAGSTLNRMRERGIRPIAGLVHHGSGPAYVNFFDGSFEKGLEAYAEAVARQFPWLEYYTPVNEPLTTARFCGLYGHWYPHHQTNYSFLKILISECKGTVLAMQAIRKINPDAKLVQTEDLGKCYSTPLLHYQAEMENQRRWLSYDLLCGRVNEQHGMWPYLMHAGIAATEVLWFKDNYCIPHVAGFNYYITSERFLDEQLQNYPDQYHGGNGRHCYADIETVKVPLCEESGPAVLLREAWAHLQLPIAITECHMHSPREDQLRWFHAIWKTCNTLCDEGIPVKAVTAWALFGLWGWNRLVTAPWGDYEPGVFNISSGNPRPTALASFIAALTRHNNYYHPVLEGEGWWQRANRHQYNTHKVIPLKKRKPTPQCKPLLVLGKSGTLGAAFGRICHERHIHHVVLSRAGLDVTDTRSIEQAIAEWQPWAIVNATGYVRVDDAEADRPACFDVNCKGPANLAALCRLHSLPLLCFSTDLVFDGTKTTPYTETDRTTPLNVYGESKVAAEGAVLGTHPEALIVRTSSFFGPWDVHNFVHKTLLALQDGKAVEAANDLFMSPTYVPDLVHCCLDLLLDEESGIFHIANDARVSWEAFAQRVALATGYHPNAVQGLPAQAFGWPAKRPPQSALCSERGVLLPNLDNALERWLQATNFTYRSGRIAV